MPEHKWDVSRLSTGERSSLKRNAGIMMRDAGADAIEGFYRAVNGKVSAYAEKAWFVSLCMQCLWRNEDQPQIKALPELLRSIYQNPDATDSSRKRCVNFLDIAWGDDGFLLGKICGVVRKLRAENSSVMPDFEALADDLNHWNDASRYVQRKWLRTICKTNQEEKEEE